MKATELRIGNYIYDDFDEVHRVECIKSDMFVSIDTLGAEQVIFSKINNKAGLFVCNEVKPIPLTEEWLLRTGAIHVFNSKRATDTSYNYGRLNLAYKKSYKYWYVTSNECGGYITKIEYVHEWQNLVFVMDGEELEVKP